jgi:isochorismate pyruvate lyase
MHTERVFSGAPWEKQIGYCRAIKKANHIFISGTTALDESKAVFKPGNAYAQTKRCLMVIEEALLQLKASLSDIVRIRMFVTDITQASEYGRAHGEFFNEFPPACSLIGIGSLILPGMLIEIEADAIVGYETL